MWYLYLIVFVLGAWVGMLLLLLMSLLVMAKGPESRDCDGAKPSS